MDAQLPRPECRGEGLELLTEQGSLPSLKQGRRGKRAYVGVGGDWEEGRKCKYLNRKIKKEKGKVMKEKK